MTATKPKSRVTVRSDIELGSHGSKWKHGWIPLNEVAAAIKAKKFGKGGGGGGSKVVGKSRIDTERQAAHAIAKAGKARPPRSAPSVSGAKADLAIRHSTYRGQPGFLVTGKDTHGRSTSVFASTREEAEKARDNIATGKPAFGDVPATSRERASTIAARGHDGKPVVIAQQRHVEAGVSLPGPKTKLPEGRKVTAHDVHGDKGEIRDAENGRILSTGHTSKRSAAVIANRHNANVIAQQRRVEAGVSLPGPKTKLPEGRKVTVHDVHGDKGEIRDAENGRILSTGHTSKRSAAVIANRHNAEVEAGKVTLTGNERYNLTTGERLPDAAPVTVSVKVDHEAVHTDADLKRQHLYAYMNRQQAHLDRTEAELKKRGYVKVGDSKWRKGGNETKAREIAALAEKTTAPKVGESVKAKKGDYAVISGHVTSTDASYKRTHTPKFTVAKVAKVDADGRATHFTRPGSSRVMATHEFTSMSAPDRPKVSVVSQDKVNTDTLHEAVSKHAGSGTFPSMDEARSFVAEHLGKTPERRVEIPKGLKIDKALTPDGRPISGYAFKITHEASGAHISLTKTKRDAENLATHLGDTGVDFTGSREAVVAGMKEKMTDEHREMLGHARQGGPIKPARKK